MLSFDYAKIVELIIILLTIVGCASFLVSVIVEVIKNVGILGRVSTQLVTLIVSLIISVSVLISICQIYSIVILWYYIFAAVILSFLVCLVAQGGWKLVADIWDRTKFHKEDFDADKLGDDIV